MSSKSLVLAAALCVSLAAVSSHAQHNPFPEIRLSEREYQGEEAVEALGHHLTKVAAHYRLSSDQLKRLLREDLSLRVDSQGLLFYAEDASLADPSLMFNPSPDTIPSSETFLLHSRPGAQGTIYLNFRGGVVSGTAWNWNGDIVAAPYSWDSDPAFSEAELREIRAIFLRIAEDYAPFDVDVTTQRPASVNPMKNIEIIFTPTYEWYGRAGGVCYVGSFGWGDARQVCWVFSSLLNNNTKYISEAGSHESGHSLGLRHWAQYAADGSKITSYYAGNGSWAPIMGVSYYRPITTWSRGEYTGAGVSSLGSMQDDIAKIRSYTGTIPDEAGGTLSSSARLARVTSPNGIQIQHRGIISSSTDVDVYRLDTLGGDINLTVNPPTQSANLDARVRLYDGTGTVLVEANPLEISSINIHRSGLAAGTYYLELLPVGSGDPYATGYSSYGSAGQYFVTGTYVPSSAEGANNPSPPASNASDP
jgi:hypothetical protein